MHTGADANAGAAKRNVKRTTRRAFNPAAVVSGRTAMILGTGIRAAGLSQIWSNEGVSIPAFEPIDFNILKTHL
jgi:hypothetical protein